jgi:hypothetical protein
MQKIMNKNTKIFLCELLFLVGCSTGLQIQEIPESANVIHELQVTETNILEAAYNQVNILSPRNFMDARVSLEKTKEAMDKQKEKKDVLHQLAISRAFLKRANEVAEIAKINMGEVITARQEAIAAGASQFNPVELSKADARLKDVTADIEADELDSIKIDRKSLQSIYQGLHLQAIKREQLIEQDVSERRASELRQLNSSEK